MNTSKSEILCGIRSGLIDLNMGYNFGTLNGVPVIILKTLSDLGIPFTYKIYFPK